jgi:hypothetical protein
VSEDQEENLSTNPPQSDAEQPVVDEIPGAAEAQMAAGNFVPVDHVA